MKTDKHLLLFKKKDSLKLKTDQAKIWKIQEIQTTDVSDIL